MHMTGYPCLPSLTSYFFCEAYNLKVRQNILTGFIAVTQVHTTHPLTACNISIIEIK